MGNEAQVEVLVDRGHMHAQHATTASTQGHNLFPDKKGYGWQGSGTGD
jgi:hypothetical protein